MKKSLDEIYKEGLEGVSGDMPPIHVWEAIEKDQSLKKSVKSTSLSIWTKLLLSSLVVLGVVATVFFIQGHEPVLSEDNIVLTPTVEQLVEPQSSIEQPLLLDSLLEISKVKESEVTVVELPSSKEKSLVGNQVGNSFNKSKTHISLPHKGAEVVNVEGIVDEALVKGTPEKIYIHQTDTSYIDTVIVH